MFFDYEVWCIGDVSSANPLSGTLLGFQNTPTKSYITGKKYIKLIFVDQTHIQFTCQPNK